MASWGGSESFAVLNPRPPPRPPRPPREIKPLSFLSSAGALPAAETVQASLTVAHHVLLAKADRTGHPGQLHRIAGGGERAGHRARGAGGLATHHHLVSAVAAIDAVHPDGVPAAVP